MPQAMIEAQGLSKTFHAHGGRLVEAVRSATFSVAAGEIFGLLGPNGAGKTTLLRMLGTIITPTSGRCVVAGIAADQEPVEARRRLGFLSGNTRLYKRLTVRELLRFFGRLYSVPDDRIAQRTGELAGLLGMEDFVDHRCGALSTGQTQKVSIARAILHDPPVLILDEPTLGLDIMTSRTILDFIIDARRRGHSIIFSTHYMTEAELLCDRIGFMLAGRIMAIGSQAELYAQTGTANLKDAFLKMADEQVQPVEEGSRT